MRKLWLLATFMSVLVVMLPVCFAQSIQITKISGQDDIYDPVTKTALLRSVDSLRVDVLAEGQDDISKDYLWLKIGTSPWKFNGECTEAEGKYSCYTTEDVEGFPQEKYSFDTLLCHDIECSDESKAVKDTGKFIVDLTEPEIKEKDITASQLPTGNVSVTYKIEDLPATDCAGLLRVDFFDVKKVYTDMINKSDCGEEETRTVDFELGEGGEKILTIRAYDRLQNVLLTNTPKFTIDKNPPRVIPGTLWIYDPQGNLLEKIPEGGTTASKIRVLIEEKENALLPESVHADFNGLLATPSPIYSYKKASYCTAKSGQKIYECFWSNVKIEKEGDAASYLISARDSYNNLMNTSAGTYAISIEKTAPALKGPKSFAVTKDDKVMNVAPAAGAYADVEINISEEYPGLDTRQLSLDFSAFNDDPQYKGIAATRCTHNITCVKLTEDKKGCIGEALENYYTCTWNNVFVNIKESKTAKVYVEAQDLFGNSKKLNFPWTMELDDKNPGIEFLGTEHVYKDKSYIKAEDKIIARIKEQSPLAEDDVVLTSDSIEGYSDGALADNCSGSDQDYTCYWEDVELVSGKSTGDKISVELDAEDFVGNKASKTETLIVDITDPSVDGARSVAKSATAEEGLEKYLKEGERMQVELYVKDTTQVEVEADFSELGLKGDYSTTCILEENEDDKWVCKFETEALEKAPLHSKKLKFNVTDIVGNKVLHEIEVDVLAVKEKPSDYWTARFMKGKQLPDKLDRTVTALRKQKAFFPVKLSNRYDVTAVKIGGLYCNTDFLDATNPPYLLNAKKEKSDGGVIYVVLTFDNTELPAGDKVGYNCTFFMTSRDADYISKPEQENVTLEMPLYSLQDVTQSQKEKLAGVKDSWLVSGKAITGMRKLFDYSNKICNLVNIIATISSIFSGSDVAVGQAQEAADVGTLGLAEPLFTSIRLSDLTLAKSADAIYSLMQYFCRLSSCDYFLGSKMKWHQWLTGKVRTVEGGIVTDRITITTEGKYPKTTIDNIMGDWFDPKRSLSLSLATACVPGIIYNLDKARQIECQYIYCMEKLVAERQSTAYMCEAKRGSDWCKYVFGEIFNMIPLAQFFDYVVNSVKEMIHDPYVLGVVSIGIFCDLFCSPILPCNKCCGTCLIYRTASKIVDLATQIFNRKTWDFTPGTDFCALAGV